MSALKHLIGSFNNKTNYKLIYRLGTQHYPCRHTILSRITGAATHTSFYGSGWSSYRQISTDAAGPDVIPEAAPSLLLPIWQALSNSAPVAVLQEQLMELHEYTGLPWWGTIVLSTVILRTVITLPLAIYQHAITARLELLQLEMPALVEELKKEAAIAKQRFKWTEEQTKRVFLHSLKKQYNKLIVRDNCHPAKTFIMLWGQLPLWICQSVALRNMVHMLPNPQSLEAKLLYLELSMGGFGWIPNLTDVDHAYILPVLLGLINLGIIELQYMSRTQASTTRFRNIATNVFRVLTVAMVPIACTVPSALCVYWVTSSTHGLFQNLLLLSPSFRRLVRIPKAPKELAQPYQHIWATLKERASLRTASKARQAATAESMKQGQTQQTKKHG